MASSNDTIIYLGLGAIAGWFFCSARRPAASLQFGSQPSQTKLAVQRPGETQAQAKERLRKARNTM